MYWQLAHPDFDEKIREYDKYLKEETADMTDEETIKFLKSEIRGSDPKSNRKIWAWVISAIAVILIAVAGYKFFYPGTEKTLSTVDSSEPTVATQVAAKKASINLEDENFLQWDTANPQKKVMANNSDDYSLPEEADEATETALEYLRHNAETLIGAATARGVTNIPEYEDLVVEINGKKYLSEKGRELYSFLEAQIVADPTTTTKIDTTAAGFTAHNSGIVDNQFTVNSSATDLSGRKVLVIQYSDGVVMYASLYCGNFFFSAPPKGVPTGEVPQPPVDTTTPPKESQTPPPTIPTTPEGLKPKDTQYYEWDITGKRGLGRLGIRVNTSGEKVFVYRYFIDGKSKFIQLGLFPSLSLNAAEEKAREFAGWLKSGIDPKAEIERLIREQEAKERQI